MGENAANNCKDLVAQFTDKIMCSEDAREAFADFHDEGLALEKRLMAIEPAFSGECGRLREDAIQIAGLLALLDEADCIDVTLAHRAISIVRWYKKSFFALLFRPYFEHMEEKCERIFDLIEASSEKRVPLRMLRNTHRITKEDITAIQAMYPSKFTIETIQASRGGRASSVIRKNERNDKI
jgi:hypothetical protein